MSPEHLRLQRVLTCVRAWGQSRVPRSCVFVASHHRPLSPPGMCVDLSSDVPYEDGEREKESMHVAEPTIPKAQEVEQGGRLRSNGSAGVAVSATEVA